MTSPSDILSVANDLVLLGREQEAEQLLRDQAPEVFAVQCPVCAALSNRPCFLYDVEAWSNARLDDDTWDERNKRQPLPHPERLQRSEERS